MLILLVIYQLLVAFGRASFHESFPFASFVMAFALVAGVYASQAGRRLRLTIAGLAAGAVVLSTTEETSGNLLFLALLATTLVITFGHVLRTTRIRLDTIFGAVCVYIQLAALWGLIYYVIARIEGPTTFSLSSDTGDVRLQQDLFYYSWVTLTTLGYGDVTPQHPLARVAANLECIVGQFYIAIVVARLVAIQVTQRLTRDDESAAG